MENWRRSWVLLVAAMLGTAGCATPGGPQSALALRWPEPPRVTRIEHVTAIRTPADLGSRPSAWERFVDFLLARKARFRAIGHPSDIEVSPNGTLVYVSDFAQGLVHVFDLVGKTGWYLGENKRFDRPFGLALDSEGRLYVAEQSARQIRVVDSAGATLRIFGSDQLIRPTDIEIDTVRGRLYVVDGSRQASPEHYVRIFDLDGNYLGEVGHGKGSGEGWLMFPTYLTLDPDGNLYVADTLNSRVSVFDPEGRFVKSVGQRQQHDLRRRLPESPHRRLPTCQHQSRGRNL
jgi:DNA-binding beta-propeller fold protein YncE